MNVQKSSYAVVSCISYGPEYRFLFRNCKGNYQEYPLRAGSYLWSDCCPIQYNTYIPHGQGQVATYGQIAAYAGNPQGARQVAWVLHTYSEKEGLPWHRVINSKGGISLGHGSGYELQKALLEKEGVTFGKGDIIDLKKYQWDPYQSRL